MTTTSSSDQKRSPYLPDDPLHQPSAPPAPPYYGTFQHNPQFLPPALPHPVPPTPLYGYQQPVPGYPVVEGTPVLLARDPTEQRLPCCGIGFGWFLFIIGWFLASIPWYIGAVMLICTRPDPRERIGLVCCTVAAAISLIVAIVSGTMMD